MADLRINPEHNGTTLTHLAQHLFFKDAAPPPQNGTRQYVVKGKEKGGSGMFSGKLDLGYSTKSFMLPVPGAEFGKVYRVRLKRIDTHGNNVSTEISDPVIIYTPAFPHVVLQNSQHSFDKNNPFIIPAMNTSVAFTEVYRHHAYKIKVVALDGVGTVIHNDVHRIKNHEHYFVPAHLPNMGFGRKYAVQGKAKITKFRKDFGPVCYIQTPEFPQPVFLTQPNSIIDPSAASIKLADKIPGATGYHYELTDTAPKDLSKDVDGTYNKSTRSIDNNYQIAIALQWFNGNGDVGTIAQNKTYWIRCRGVRKTSSSLVEQEGPFTNWMPITTEP